MTTSIAELAIFTRGLRRTNRNRKELLPLFLIPLLLTACAVQTPQSASVPATSTSTPTPAAVVSSSLGNISWLMPGSWQVVRPRTWTAPIGPLLFISNARITDPCASSNRGTDCWKPLTKLPLNGILITFGGSAIVQTDSLTPIFVALAVSRKCQEMGGVREIATFSLGLGIDACLGGPDFAANEALFKQLVSSMKKSGLLD